MSTYRFTRSNVDETVDQVYDFIVKYIREEGYPPAVRDICKGVGIRSTSTIHGHLKRLQEAERIDYQAGKRRAITVPATSTTTTLFTILMFWGNTSYNTHSLSTPLPIALPTAIGLSLTATWAKLGIL